MPDDIDPEQSKIAQNFFGTPEPQKPDDKPKDDKSGDKPDDKPKDEPIEPTFTRDTPPKDDKSKDDKKSKEESNGILRKQRDEYKKAAEGYQTIFGEHPPEVLKPVWDFVAENIDGGVVSSDTVIQTIESLRSLKEENEQLKGELQQKDLTIEKLDIKSSPAFESKYVKPYKEAHNDLFLEFANVGPDSKVIGAASAQAFLNFITDPKGEELDGIKMKAAMKQYAESYKQETGEEASLPSVSDLMKSYRSFLSKRSAMNDAYTNWGVKKKEDEERLTVEQQQQQEMRERQSKRLRSDLVSKAFREFPFDAVEKVVDEKEIQAIFREQYQVGENILEGKQAMTYDQVMTAYVKAKLFDKLQPKIKEWIELEESEKEGARNHLPGSREPAPGKKGEEKHWLTIGQ